MYAKQVQRFEIAEAASFHFNFQTKDKDEDVTVIIN